mmetsp:Transcript_91885/g.284156  ORF Transcript_91885/g.284156 Transcript_91885/m.284156 type:complete len:234 (-) Transcript_91885:85-786(-)
MNSPRGMAPFIPLSRLMNSCSGVIFRLSRTIQISLNTMQALHSAWVIFEKSRLKQFMLLLWFSFCLLMAMRAICRVSSSTSGLSPSWPPCAGGSSRCARCLTSAAEGVPSRAINSMPTRSSSTLTNLRPPSVNEKSSRSCSLRLSSQSSIAQRMEAAVSSSSDMELMSLASHARWLFSNFPEKITPSSLTMAEDLARRKRFFWMSVDLLLSGGRLGITCSWQPSAMLYSHCNV